MAFFRCYVARKHFIFTAIPAANMAQYKVHFEWILWIRDRCRHSFLSRNLAAACYTTLYNSVRDSVLNNVVQWWIAKPYVTYMSIVCRIDRPADHQYCQNPSCPHGGTQARISRIKITGITLARFGTNELCNPLFRPIDREQKYHRRRKTTVPR